MRAMQSDMGKMQSFRDLAAVTTVPEASRLWGISRPTLYRWCAEGRIVATKPDGGHTWLVSMRSMLLVCGDPKYVGSCETLVLDSLAKMV